MEFIKGVCPHCGGELQIPQDRESIICMYCGVSISQEDAVNGQEQKSRPEPVSEEAATEALQNLLYGIENPMQFFKKAIYMEFFKKYIFENAKNLALLEQFYLASPEPMPLMQRVAEPMVARVEEDLKSLRGRKKDELQMDYNLSMVVYVFPALLETNEKSGKAWIEVLTSTWKQHFPKTDLKFATAKEINAGFKYRFCYITTAVCDYQNKADDCYELSLFRSFRDDYLLQRSDGEALVHEYYDVAPSIVKHIGQRENVAEIYEGIWKQYLSPCIHLLETNQKEACVELYRDMVYDLKELYFH